MAYLLRGGTDRVDQQKRGRQTALLLTLTLASTASVFASPIYIVPPATETGERIFMDIRVKDRNGTEVIRRVSTERAPIGGSSSAENARQLKRAIDDLSGEYFETEMAGNQLKLSPGENAADGLAGEPSHYFDLKFNRMFNLLFSQTLVPAELRGEEIGYGRLTWLAGTAAGSGFVGFAVGGFTASVNTYSDMSGNDLLLRLHEQFVAGGVPSIVDGNTLTAFSHDLFRISYDDAGFHLAGEGGTAPVPEPSAAYLLMAGCSLIAIGRWRRSRR